MVKLSVNVNKIATLRNARGDDYPNLISVVKDIISFGADGITVHPRPDERHILYKDAYDIKKVIFGRDIEYNIEGNTINSNFIDLVSEVCPTQVTLVPDPQGAITSNFGWDTVKNYSFLKEVTDEFKSKNIRTSIFVFPQKESIYGAAKVGADRIELFTKEYADLYKVDRVKAISKYLKAASLAKQIGVDVNAGHDLNLENIEFLISGLKDVLDEVSIGHHLICESLYLGLDNVINLYLKKIRNPKV